MSDAHQTYGDDGPAYGDDGPAYGDHGPAYHDAGPTSQNAQPAGYPQSFNEPDATDYTQEAEYGADDADVEVDESADDDLDARNPLPWRRIAAIGGGLLLLGTMGAGGYFFLLAPSGDDPLSGLRAVPLVGEMLAGPAPTAKGQAPKSGQDAKPVEAAVPALEENSFWSGWLSKMRGAAHDDGPVVAQLEDAAVETSRAIDTYYAGHHVLPGTTLAIVEELHRMDLKPLNPYRSGEPVKIELGALPKDAGSIAYLPRAGHYELRIGDGHGNVLTLNKVPLVIEGPNDAEALPGDENLAAVVPVVTPASDAATGAAPVTNVAIPASGTPSGAQIALGAGTVGRPNPRASGMLALLPKGTPAPLPAVPSAVADPGMVANPNLTPHDALVLRLKRNKEFDYWRVRGISLVYSARTEEALDAFKKALEIHPNDESVTKWVLTINGVIDKTRSEALAKHNEERNQALRQTAQRAPATLPQPPQMAPPRPRNFAPPTVVQDQRDDASKMFDELRKADKVPLLAPPKLDP